MEIIAKLLGRDSQRLLSDHGKCGGDGELVVRHIFTFS
jgi:hypothetical protein